MEDDEEMNFVKRSMDERVNELNRLRIDDIGSIDAFSQARFDETNRHKQSLSSISVRGVDSRFSQIQIQHTRRSNSHQYNHHHKRRESYVNEEHRNFFFADSERELLRSRSFDIESHFLLNNSSEQWTKPPNMPQNIFYPRSVPNSPCTIPESNFPADLYRSIDLYLPPNNPNLRKLLPMPLPQNIENNRYIPDHSIGKHEESFHESLRPKESRACEQKDLGVRIGQLLTEASKRQAGLWTRPESSTDEDEESSNGFPDSSYKEINEVDMKRSHSGNNRISIMNIIKPGFRKLWGEIPEVQKNGILIRLAPRERRLQEAFFEVMTSEASYLRSLDLLLNMFYNSSQLSNSNFLELRKHGDLFSNLITVYQTSKRLIGDLERRWQESVIIHNVCDILLGYAENSFHCYIDYCRFKKKQENILKELQEQDKLGNILKKMESHPISHGLSIHSYFLLPVQRIMRYPLLLQAILDSLDIKSPNYNLCKTTLFKMNEIVNDCNVAAEQYEQYEIIVPKIKFNDLKPIAMHLHPRWLLLQDEVTKLTAEFSKNNRIPNWTKSQNHLLLFNDLILITKKKKGEDSYSVLDYCYRSILRVNQIHHFKDPPEKSSYDCNYKLPVNYKYLLSILLIHNHCGKSIEYFFNFLKESDRLNWFNTLQNKNNSKHYDKYSPVVYKKDNGNRKNSIDVDIVECTPEIFI